MKTIIMLGLFNVLIASLGIFIVLLGLAVIIALARLISNLARH